MIPILINSASPWFAMLNNDCEKKRTIAKNIIKSIFKLNLVFNLEHYQIAKLIYLFILHLLIGKYYISSKEKLEVDLFRWPQNYM